MTAVAAKPLLVVKYGGNAMGAIGEAVPGRDPLLADVAARHRSGEPIVLVHGGGPEIDEALAARGIASARIEGQRVTDAAALAITEAVLCGTINKRIVRALQSLDVQAAGISGQDAGTLVARRLSGPNGEDLGYVGEVESVETKLIETLLDSRILPVVAPVALDEMRAYALNVNADAAAGAVAVALHARALILATNVPRVLRDPDDRSSGIDRLTAQEATAFARSNACRSSMKPKVMAAAHAAGNGVPCYICNATATIAQAIAGNATIVSNVTT